MTTGHVDHHWRCDCGGGHFLTITWWPDDLRRDLEAEGYLNVEGDFWTRWRDRIAQAWRVLRSGHSGTRVGVVMDPAKARAIAAALTEFADVAASPEAARPVLRPRLRGISWRWEVPPLRPVNSPAS